MPTRPTVRTLNASSVDILNAIRNNASANYRDYVPAANPSLDSIREIGAVIMDYPVLQNEFLNALVNRIGRVMISSKMYENPWNMFKKGLLEHGESVEEIFVNIAKPFVYDPAVAETKVFEREIPDVRAAFHILNYRNFYKATIQQEELRLAFLSWDGVSDLIAKIVDSMYTAANFDEFLVMKYMVARHALNGRLYAKQVATVSADNAKAIASTMKGISNNLEFMSNKYNITGVMNYTKKDNQYLIVNSDFDATMDVEVLASAFNMSKAEFSGHRVLVDSFGELDNERLALIFKDEPAYTPVTDEELEALKEIPAVLVDEDWFMIFDNLQNFTEQYNAQGLYWNYFYHVWKTFSVSPFTNAVIFVPGVPAIDSVAVSPATATVSPGQSILLSATVVTENFASKAVKWTLSAVDGEGAEITDIDANITPLGMLSVGSSVATGTVLTVSATSVEDSTKTATATVTVA